MIKCSQARFRASIMTETLTAAESLPRLAVTTCNMASKFHHNANKAWRPQKAAFEQYKETCQNQGKAGTSGGTLGQYFLKTSDITSCRRSQMEQRNIFFRVERNTHTKKTGNCLTEEQEKKIPDPVKAFLETCKQVSKRKWNAQNKDWLRICTVLYHSFLLDVNNSKHLKLEQSRPVTLFAKWYDSALLHCTKFALCWCAWYQSTALVDGWELTEWCPESNRGPTITNNLSSKAALAARC